MASCSEVSHPVCRAQPASSCWRMWACTLARSFLHPPDRDSLISGAGDSVSAHRWKKL